MAVCGTGRTEGAPSRNAAGEMVPVAGATGTGAEEGEDARDPPEPGMVPSGPQKGSGLATMPAWKRMCWSWRASVSRTVSSGSAPRIGAGGAWSQ